MFEREKYDKINFSLLLFILILFLLLCLIYFSSIIHYLKQNINANLTILWIDYFITVSIGITFTITYLITLLINKTKRISTLEELYSNKLYILSNTFLMSFFYTLISNTVFDIIKSFEISFKIIQLKKIKTDQLPNLIEELKEIDIMNFIKPHMHYNFIIIINVINIILLIFSVLIYTNFISMKDHNFYLLQIYHMIVLSVFFLIIIIINYLKKKIINNKYYNRNKFAMNIYNINLNQIKYYIDILLFKIIIDLFLNIPLIFYISFLVFNSLAMLFFELSLFIFVFIGGNFLLSIDNNYKYNNKIRRSKLLKLLFFLKDIQFRFVDNGFNTFINEYEYYYNCSPEEKKMLKSFNINFIEENLNLKNNECHLNDINNYDYDVEVKEDIIKSSEDDNSNLNKISEYFILYKLLYIYFDKNKDLYSNLLKKLKKNGGSLFRQYSLETNSSGKKSNKRKYKKQKEGENNLNMEEYILKIEKVSRFSELESKNLILFIKLYKDDLFKTVQEKELLEELIQKYKKPKKYKPVFTIEALSHYPLFEIFPFYQMKIEDILKSLQPSNNMKIFKQFLENLNKTNNNESQKNINSESDKKMSNESEDTKNLKNEKDSNENNESESKSSESTISNCYNTFNNLIMMEIYNKSDFIDYEQISKLTSSFKNYSLKIVKQMKNTFLPLLLGIYNIKFFDQNKIVIVYKNPLYFTNFVFFNNWINFYITEEEEKTKKSIVTKDNVIDINEIEIKDNLKMNDVDYEEIKKNLKNDFNYLNNLNFQVFPIIHLFIGNENNVEEKLKKNHVLSESFSFGSQGSQQQLNFSILLNSFSDQLSSSNSFKKKDLLGLEQNSLLEKQYYSSNGNKDMHTIKIYLTNFFRLGHKINKEEGKIFLFNSESYGIFLQTQLLSYLTKNNQFSNEDKDSDNEKRKISIKSSDEENIIIKSGDS